MKNLSNITLLLIFLISSNSFSQIVKADNYRIGTKITYYTSACGTTIPEANDKISFCDEAGNLGVVEESYGLNDNEVKKIVPNYFNNDEVFITGEGYSIHKEDGSWLNIPDLAIPTTNLSSTIASEEAIVTATGKLLFGDSNGSTSDLIYLDLSDLSFNSFDILGDYDARKFTHDPSTGITYVIAKGISDLRLYSIDNDTITSLGIISSLPANAFFNSNSIAFADDFIYFAVGNILYKIDVTDPANVTLYDDNTLPSGETIRDIETGINNEIWLSFAASFSGNNGNGLGRFDLNTETFEFYTLDNFGNGNFPMGDLTVAPNGNLWIYLDVPSYNNNGFAVFEPGESDPWTYISYSDFEDFGFPITSAPTSIDIFNQGVYFTFASSADQQTFEVVKLKDGTWFGLTDDTPQNISLYNSDLFGVPHYLVPAKDSGMWSYNEDKNILLKFDGDNIKSNVFNIENNIFGDNKFVVDINGFPTSLFGSTSKIVRYNEPIIQESSPLTFGPVRISAFQEELWLTSFSDVLHVFIDDIEVSNYTLTNYDSSEITPDSDGNIIYSTIDNDNDKFTVYQIDRNTNTLNTFDYTYNFNLVNSPENSDIIQVSLGNGKMAFLYQKVIFLFDNGTITDVPLSNIGFSSSATVRAAVSDQVGNLVLTIDDFLVRILDPFGSFNLESYQLLSFNDSILPDIAYFPRMLALDSEGSVWLQGYSQWTKIYLTNPIPVAPVGDSPRITGKVYYDKNDNDVFDPGEEYANQRLAIRKDSQQSVRYAFTKENGDFLFSYEGTGDYDITNLGSSPYKIADSPYLSFTVSDTTQDTDLGLIKLETRRVESLLVKSSEKVGAWGFERVGFENTFTTAIGNTSNVKTFTNLDLQFLFKNQDEFSNNILPQINEINIYEVTTTENIPLIYSTTIIPSSHRWTIQSNPSDYSINTLSISPTVTASDDIVTIDMNISQIQPNDMIIIEVKTNIFSAESVNEVVEYGLSSIGGDNIGEFDGPESFMLIPRQADESSLGLPENLPPEIDPLNPVPPTIPDKPVFAPERSRTRIFSSYDPNDKLVSPGLPDTLNDIDIDTPFLTYTIRFENEGNFSAKDIFILDELDPNLDLNSVQLIESSHDVIVDQLEIDGKTSLRFFFENIFLDFTDNDPIASQGYVKFAVRPIDNIPEDTIVENTAAIYFDQNPPIITNTTQHKFVVITMSNEEFGEDSPAIKAYPNPVSDFLQINLPIQDDYNIEIYNLSGTRVFTKMYKNQNHVLIPFERYARGQYIVKINCNNLNKSIKVIK